jgi:hypothetical protein
MSVEETEITVHIDQEQSWYDGDYTIRCAVTLSSPDINGKKITIPYEGEYKEIIHGQMFKDIAAYLESPERWTKAYILGGEDNQEKLREYEAEIAQYRKDIEGYRKSIEWRENSLKRYEDAIAKIKADMEEESHE